MQKIIGIIIVLLGIGFLLNELHVLSFSVILKNWWPLIFFIIAFIQIIQSGKKALFTFFIFILIGTASFLHIWTTWSIWSIVWPTVIILFGLSIVLKGKSFDREVDKDDLLEIVAILSGTEHKSVSENFKGGNILSILGGIQLDLREVTIQEEQPNINITVILGGVEIIVPDNVEIKIDGTPILGGWEDKRKVVEKSQQTIHLHCVSILGGVDIK